MKKKDGEGDDCPSEREKHPAPRKYLFLAAEISSSSLPWR